MFAAGQAYVALSRIRTLEDLQIINFDKAAIKCDPAVQDEMTRLQTRVIGAPDPMTLSADPTAMLKIGQVNINGFLNHLDDVTKDENILACDVVRLTQSHLQQTDTVDSDTFWPGSHVFRHDWSGNTAKGGIVIMCKNEMNPRELQLRQSNLECGGVQITVGVRRQINILTVYLCAQTVTRQECANIVTDLVSAHDLAESGTIIADHGSTIDHIYYNQERIDTISEVLIMYNSDHDLTVLMLKKSTQ